MTGPDRQLVRRLLTGMAFACAVTGAAAQSPETAPSAKPPAAAPIAKPVTASTLPAARPPSTPKGGAAGPPPIAAASEPEDVCAVRGRNLIHDSRSPGGCTPCPSGRIPNSAHQACVVPLPSPYRGPAER